MTDRKPKPGMARIQIDVPRKTKLAFKARCTLLDMSMGERVATLIKEDIQKRMPSQTDNDD